MIKRIFPVIAIITAVLAWIMIPGKTVSAASYGVIRVKISMSGESASIIVDGNYILQEDPGLTLPKGAYTISVSSASNIRITGCGVDKVAGATLTFVRHQAEAGANNHLAITNTQFGSLNYLGNMAFSVSSGALLAINHVPLEEYLYGVVAYEMSDSFPLEALKAQAVCARGYAIRSISPSGAYDIGDTSADQVYRGYNLSFSNVIAAVEATRGQVLTYGGAIIQTYYAASNGGQTELPGNAWGGGEEKNSQYPYLAQKDDPYDLENPSSLYQTIFVPGSSQEPVAIPGSHAVRVVRCCQYVNARTGPGTQYNVAGQAPLNTVYELISTTGDWHKVKFNGYDAYISAEYGMVVANGRFLYGNCVLADLQAKAFDMLGVSNISPTDVKIIAVTGFAPGVERWPGTGSRSYLTANANVTVQYVAAGTETLSGEVPLSLTLQLMNVSGGSVLTAHDYLHNSLRLRGVSAATGGYQVTCGRYGHGIGMSQRGAQQMASAPHNKPFNEILSFYFTGSALAAVDTTAPGLPLVPTLGSTQYTVGAGTITGLPVGTSVEQLLAGLAVTNGSVRLVSASGAEKPSGVLATGDELLLTYYQAAIFRRYSIIVYGDVDGDGGITLVDLLRIQKHLLGTTNLQGAHAIAADVSKDGNLSILDLLRVQKHLLGTVAIVP